ncbi:MAG: DUF58 domain-containing protein [Blastocatellia bacterium]|nr:DUF58 domain-containing protein [Blastocatellia bacterium]
MSDQLQQFLKNGERAGMRYKLCIPHRAATGQAGNFLGMRAGSSLDFKDHRDYQAGDDLRHIDWNAYARSDKLIVKLYREEVSPHLDLVMDCSRSMDAEGTRKAEAALGLSALLAVAAANAGYSHCVWSARNGVRRIENPGDQPHIWRGLRFDSNQTLESCLAGSPPSFKPQGVRIVVSDLFWLGDPLQTLQHVSHGAANLVVIQLLAATDVQPELKGNVRLVDSETQEIRELFADSRALEQYRSAFLRHQSNWETACRHVGARLIPVVDLDFLDHWDLSPLVRESILAFA